MPFFQSEPTFVWSVNAEGLAIRFSSAKTYRKARRGGADELAQLGFVRMQMLAECGQAEVKEVDAGIFISSGDAVRLDVEVREGFLLPPPWPGGMRLQTESVPQSSSFKARIGLVYPRAQIRWDWKLRGPILLVGSESYLPTAAQYAALRAFQNWAETGERDELSNLSLLATLREARESGCHVDLDAYRETLIANARELTINARTESSTGDMILRPVVSGDFPEVSAEEVEARFGQIAGKATRAVLRVGQTIVLLDQIQTQQARALVERGRVPKAEVLAFQKNPSGWLAENVFPDIQTEFSPRVVGIGFWKSAYAGPMWEETEDWFGRKPEPERKPKERGGQKGGSVGEIEAEPVVPLIVGNDTELGFGWRELEMVQAGRKPDFSRYARAPLKHQEEAVLWLLRHAQRALRRRSPTPVEGDVVLYSNNGPARSGMGAGALLADDMGLGKTFSTLIFLREWFELWREVIGTEPPAVLIVAPLSLLENWKAEITKSYGAGSTVFRRVLLAQPDGDLRFVRRSPSSRDRAVPGEVLEYGLGFGDGTERSLDLPGSCILTTYQTLRDYRFSFAKAEWSAAIFDEAQNIKNPNALQTIAAKSLKALFRLTLTGTPVENHLGDFWSIMDASEPGPLGSFAEFRNNWITPMTRDLGSMGELGLKLREHVGELMLRRMKEERLTGLPKKNGHDRAISVDMTAEQVNAYEAVIASIQGEEVAAEGLTKGQNHQLAALWELRRIMLHPDLLAGGSIGTARNTAQSRAILARSGKLAWLLGLMDEIKGMGEKVLIFCVQKKLQEALAHHLSLIYGFDVPIINGDTKATSRHDSETTRLGLIEQFSNRNGFGICVLSPIAAGAGLNIVAANHVIHLERHWNPAKEDQATDRAYRIGQTRPVTVYLPMMRHPDPERRSFDQVLQDLIGKKRGLQGAMGLIPPQSVTGGEIIGQVFGSGTSKAEVPVIDLDAALRLPWRLFEALIAVIYHRDAKRVILTPGGSDHGCDVVVLQHGPQQENLLIQCKTTSRDELDSEVAVREVEGARPYYENALGVIFRSRCLHTTARRLGRRTLQAAQICGVTVHSRAWLSNQLEQNKFYLSELVEMNAHRERVA